MSRLELGSPLVYLYMNSLFARLRTPSLIWISTAIYVVVGLFDGSLTASWSSEATWGYTIAKITLFIAALFIGFEAAYGRRRATIIMAYMLIPSALLAYIAYQETH